MVRVLNSTYCLQMSVNNRVDAVSVAGELITVVSLKVKKPHRYSNHHHTGYIL